MSDVSVLGLGVMGAALARALINKGMNVTVWNRTAAKMKPLVDLGGIAARTVASAIEASPLTIVCVGNYDDTDGLLETEDSQKALPGKTLVQLTSGRPAQARQAEARAAEAGYSYLDGAIMAYPNQIGLAETIILIGGNLDAYNGCSSLLTSLAGDLTYLGDNIGLPSTLDGAILSIGFGFTLGLLQGSLICEAEGFPVSDYAEIIPSLMPTIGAEGKQVAQKVADGNYDNTEASLSTYSQFLDSLITTCGEININDDFLRFASKLFHRGMDAGYGDQDVSALIQTLRR